MWKRWLLIAVCLILAFARFIWPDLKVDTTTVWLLVVAAALFVLPEMRFLAPYVKRIKVGSTEIEMQEIKKDVQALGKEVEQAQAAIADRPSQKPVVDVTVDVSDVVSVMGRSPRAALLLLSTKIEHQVTQRLQQAGLQDTRRYQPITMAVRRGVEHGVFPPEVMSAFQDFWTVRNRIIHDAAFEVSDSTIMSLISVGTDILRLLAVSGVDVPPPSAHS